MILITRPYPEAKVFQKKLTRVHIPSIIAPLLFVEDYDLSDVLKKEDISQFSWIVTSLNALRAVIKQTHLRPRYLFTLSERIKNYAQKVTGISRTYVSTRPDGQHLANLILKSFSKGPFLFLRGADVSFDLKDYLSLKGIFIEEVTVYQTHFVAFEDTVIHSIKNNYITHVTSFSRKTAIALNQQIQKNSLQESLIHLKLLALSPQNISPINHYPWKEKIIASTTADLIASLIKA